MVELEKSDRPLMSHQNQVASIAGRARNLGDKQRAIK